MNSQLSHTAKRSNITRVWHLLKPVVPAVVRFQIRNKLQFIHSRKLSNKDALLLSYPKSGSTWLRSMLLMCLSDENIAVSELAKWIPPLHMVSAGRLSNTRIVRSHDSLGTPGFKRASKALILVRDPRAISVSYFHHQQRRDRDTTIEECADKLLADGFDDIGSWQMHVRNIITNTNNVDIKVVRYEDLLTQTEIELRSILSFFEIETSSQRIKEAIEENSPKKLREKRAKAGVEDNSSGASDVRNAKAYSWISECPLLCQELISSKAATELEFLGYEQS